MTNIPLSLFNQGKTGIVNNIMGGKRVCMRLSEMGFNKGKKIKVVKNDIGPIIVYISNSKIALGRGLAQKIMVSE